jgi:hypothetical protein
LGSALAIRAVEDAHNSGLSCGIGGSLRHLPMRVEGRAIDGQPDCGKQKDAHRHRYENDCLSIFIFKSGNEAFRSHDEAPQ